VSERERERERERTSTNDIERDRERERERERDCKGLPCTAETDIVGEIAADWFRR
jgi:hypothetical protein